MTELKQADDKTEPARGPFWRVRLIAGAWSAFYRELLDRAALLLSKPRTLWAAVLYIFIAIMVLGGVGTWITYALHRAGQSPSRDVVVSALTYVLALSFTGLTDAVRDDDSSPLMRLFVFTIGILALLPVTLAASKMALTPTSAPPTIALGVLLWWTAPSWAVWALANVSEKKFPATARPDAPAGGDPLRKL